MNDLGNYIVHVHPDLESDVMELLSTPMPIDDAPLIYWLLQKDVRPIPYKNQLNQMIAKPIGFTWSRKPWKTMALLSGIEFPC